MEPARVQRSATRAIGPDSSGQGSLPHAGGAEALYLSTNSSASPSAIETQLKSDAVAASTKSRDGTVIKRLFGASGGYLPAFSRLVAFVVRQGRDSL